ncbi:ricin B lectin domain-containing protein [Irpex lacteus]|nr:ricin B lectin domain-containing protein [Irpex lacteus]
MCIVDGTYTIKNAKAQTSFLTMDQSLAQQPTYVFGYPWCGQDTQKWRIMKRGNSYNIQNVGANKYLAVDGNAGDNRSVFGMQRPSNWTIAQGKGNHVRLYIQHTPFNLDLAGHGDASPGTRVSVWGNNPNNVNQCWILEKVQPAPRPSALNKASIRSGAYLVVNAHNNKVLDLSASDNKSIITFPLHGGANQQWRIEPLGEGYSIRSISSGKYVTFEERIGDGALVIANGFPVSWDVSSVWNSSDV